MEIPLLYRVPKLNFLILQVEAFWVVMPCSVVVRYQHFRGHFTLKMEAAWTSEK